MYDSSLPHQSFYCLLFAQEWNKLLLFSLTMSFVLNTTRHLFQPGVHFLLLGNTLIFFNNFCMFSPGFVKSPLLAHLTVCAGVIVHFVSRFWRQEPTTYCKVALIDQILTHTLFGVILGKFEITSPHFPSWSHLPVTLFPAFYHLYPAIPLPRTFPWSICIFLVSVVTPYYILRCEDLKLGTTEERKQWHLSLWVWVTPLSMIDQ